MTFGSSAYWWLIDWWGGIIIQNYINSLNPQRVTSFSTNASRHPPLSTPKRCIDLLIIAAPRHPPLSTHQDALIDNSISILKYILLAYGAAT
jgi:hypothetical protein